MIDKQAVEAMLERKKRALERKVGQSFDINHPFDAVGKAVSVANIQGAIDVLEELLHDEKEEHRS